MTTVRVIFRFLGSASESLGLSYRQLHRQVSGPLPFPAKAKESWSYLGLGGLFCPLPFLQLWLCEFALSFGKDLRPCLWAASQLLCLLLQWKPSEALPRPRNLHIKHKGFLEHEKEKLLSFSSRVQVTTRNSLINGPAREHTAVHLYLSPFLCRNDS